MKTTSLSDLEREAEPDETANPCVGCGGADFEVLLTPRQVEAEARWLRRFYRHRVTGGEDSLEDRAAFTQDEPTSIVRCVFCGMVMRSPRPTPEALRAMYARDTYGKEALERLAECQREFFDNRMPDLWTALPPPARILEVGPFVGGFLGAACAAGYEAVGTDVGEETVAFMRDQGLDVREGDFREVDLPAGAWDGVFIWNTFDQMEEPRTVLNRAAALLKPGGLLVLRVPNGAFETGCLQLRRAFHAASRAGRIRRAQAYNNFVTFPYLNGYTPEALNLLLEAAGFRVEKWVGDTLVRLADEDTKSCAVDEEARTQRAVRRFTAHTRRKTGHFVAPWIEVWARPGE